MPAYASAPGSRPAVVRDPLRRRAVLAPEGLGRVPLRRRERSRSGPVRRGRADRGRIRSARDHDRGGHVPPLRALRGPAPRRTSHRRQRGDLRPRFERAAARRMDERRRGRSADLPWARQLRRGVRSGRGDPPRAAVHRRMHPAVLRLAGSAPSGRRRSRLSSDGSQVPAQDRVRRQRLLRADPDRPAGDEALRDDRRR